MGCREGIWGDGEVGVDPARVRPVPLAPRTPRASCDARCTGPGGRTRAQGVREARARSATAKSIHGESGDKGGADKHRVDICRSARSPPWFPSGRAVVVDRLGDFGGARVGPVRDDRATRHRGASLLVSADLRCTCVSGAILILTSRLSAPQPVIREPRPRNRRPGTFVSANG